MAVAKVVGTDERTKMGCVSSIHVSYVAWSAGAVTDMRVADLTLYLCRTSFLHTATKKMPLWNLHIWVVDGLGVAD